MPRALGGLQVDMTTWLKTVTELGRGDGGVAWAVTLVTACNWMAASMYPRHLVEEVFAKPDTCVAGVFANRGCKARPVDGGILIEKGICTSTRVSIRRSGTCWACRPSTRMATLRHLGLRSFR